MRSHLIGLLRAAAVTWLFIPRTAGAETIVAAVGDSITAGDWPSKLGARLGDGYRVNNYGNPGTTLLKKGDAPYWNFQQFKDSHSVAADIVVIMLGTNDSKPQNWIYQSEFGPDYEALIDSYRALPSQPRVLINLPPPAGKNAFGIRGEVIENEVLPLVRAVASKKGTGLIDVFSAFGGHAFDPSLYLSPEDNVHPNPAGAQRIADTVYAAIIAPPPDAVGGQAGAGGAAGSGSASAGSGAPAQEVSNSGAGGTMTAGTSPGGAGGSGGTTVPSAATNASAGQSSQPRATLPTIAPSEAGCACRSNAQRAGGATAHGWLSLFWLAWARRRGRARMASEL